MSEQYHLPAEEGENPTLQEEYNQKVESGEIKKPEEAPLLAGKYKSVEDLENAYQHLQKKLGTSEDAEAPSGDTTPNTTEPSQEEAAKEEIEQTTEEEVDQETQDILQRAEVTMDDLSDEWFANGRKYTEETYKKFEALGISRDLLNEQSNMREELSVLKAERQKNEVLGIVGGEDGYSKVRNWAATNLSPEEQSAYNLQVNSDDLGIVKAAVQGLHARYLNSVGNEPKQLKTGQADSGSTTDVFQNFKQVQAAMRDNRYNSKHRDHDPAYVQYVEDKVKRSRLKF